MSESLTERDQQIRVVRIRLQILFQYLPSVLEVKLRDVHVPSSVLSQAGA